MKWIEADSEYKLRSGKRVYANNGILGLGHSAIPDEVSEGYDGEVGTRDDFTDAERREMAAYMIARWRAWAR